MAHQINTYIGRQAAWHKLGTVTGRYMTWTEILANGGLDFQVAKAQLTHPRTGELIDAYGTFRTDNDAFLGTVGKDYTVIQHDRGFEMIDALVASSDGAHYETAGVLRDGQMVWGLADLNLTASIGDDVQKGYLLFCTSHDGTLSHVYRTCLERVVCRNTLDVALREKTKNVFRVRHTKNSGARISDAHDALANIADDVKTVEGKLNFLANRKVTRETMTAVFDRLFPVRTKDDGKPVLATRRDNILADILQVFESNDRNAFPEQRGTAYNLLNAITGYTDHERSTQGDRRAESALFGTGLKLKTDAMDVIMESANNMPLANVSRPIYQIPQSAPVSTQVSTQVSAPVVGPVSGGSLLDAIVSQHV